MARLSTALALAGLGATLAGCASHASHPAPETAPIGVGIATAHMEQLPVVYRASGTVRGRNTAILTSKTTGYVRAVRVRPGDRVVAGQPLVELEANDVRASVARARAGLDQSTEARAAAESGLEAAHAAAKIARSTYDRAGVLLKDNAIPQQQYDEAEAAWKSAIAQEKMAESRVRSVSSGIEEAKAVLGEAQVTLGYADIVAPFAGRVLERRVDPGTLASPGTPLLVISDEGALRVEAAVEESYVDLVKIGGDATVEIETLSKPLVGTVGEIVPTVDVASRAFLVKIDLLPDAGPLRPGTFARVSFPVGTKPRLVAPTTALTSFGALDRVFVVDGGHAHLRMVTRGEAQGPWTEILSGLSAGETLVAAPPAALRDGTPVEARP
jgi:multidrug efflux pump subunit AcrA (membrane-fusion protein)